MSRVVLVELFVQSDDTLAFVLRDDRESPRLLRVPIGGPLLLEWTRELLRDIQSGGAIREIQAPLQPLLDALAQDTEVDDVVYVVPHGPLHLVPLHALEVAGAPLIRRNPVVYAPSASVLASVVGRKHNGDARGAIVAGNTRGDLVFAEDEAEMVAGLLAVEAIPGRQATRRRLLDSISASGDLRILHLACHGKFDVDDALASGILTAVEKDGGEEAAVLRARDLLDAGMAADLVCLSACESGISERRPGDELVGLTRALVVAGARTVLASLWKVNDLSTSILMRRFYEAWVHEGLPKAQALRCAQCHLMDLTAAGVRALQESLPFAAANRDFGGPWDVGSASRASDPNAHIFASPRHWAAFTLVGDWR